MEAAQPSLPDQTAPNLAVWEYAGLMVTYWCNAKCAFCYVYSSPDRGGSLSVGDATRMWRGLDELAARHGKTMRIHLAGGEPFGDWTQLVSIIRAARDAGLTRLEKVETNAFWATTDVLTRARLELLDALGMEKLIVSADVYHQEFIPFDRVQRCVEMARKVLGRGRVTVRWWDFFNRCAEGTSQAADDRGAADRGAMSTRAEGWHGQAGQYQPARASRGSDTARESHGQVEHNLPMPPESPRPPADLRHMSDEQRRRAYAEALDRHADRLTGRAADRLAEFFPRHAPEHFAGDNCIEPVLHSRHVHIDPYGNVFPGVCNGIILGNAFEQEMPALWQNLAENWRDHPIVGPVVRGGSYTLYQQAEKLGYAPLPDGYANKCHLCQHVRQFLFERGGWESSVGPAECYANDRDKREAADWQRSKVQLTHAGQEISAKNPSPTR